MGAGLSSFVLGDVLVLVLVSIGRSGGMDLGFLRVISTETSFASKASSFTGLLLLLYCPSKNLTRSALSLN